MLRGDNAADTTVPAPTEEGDENAAAAVEAVEEAVEEEAAE